MSSRLSGCRRSALNPSSLGRGGFTLLEMLLTLAMSVVLMVLVGSAIDFYARQMRGAQEQYQQSEIATAILQMIEDDLRMATTVNPVDTAALEEILSSAAAPLEALSAMTGDTEAPPTGSSDATSDVSEDMSSLDAGLESANLDLATAMGVLQSPGLIGDETQLQVDVSRLPTLEQMALDPDLASSGTAELLDRPSDIKTISYFLQPSGQQFGIVDPVQKLVTASGSTETLPSGGLVRRTLDRSITTHAMSTGGLTRLEQTGDLIASEVIGLSFEYFDGINWLTFYSSDDTGVLPQAVRITLQMQAINLGEIETAESNLAEPRAFTHVVFLPMAQPQDDSELLSEDTDMTEATL
ncbi:MAG: prepilin-type N-terminal cleavage/methylation domain-containing protein [Planctomycetota bacterium]